MILEVDKIPDNIWKRLNTIRDNLMEEGQYITKVVKTKDCWVICVCDEGGRLLMQPPYAFKGSGDLYFYNMLNPKHERAFNAGEVVYEDTTMLDMRKMIDEAKHARAAGGNRKRRA